MKIVGKTTVVYRRVEDLKVGQIGEITNRPDLHNESYVVRIDSSTVIALPACNLWVNNNGSAVKIRILDEGESITLIQN